MTVSKQIYYHRKTNNLCTRCGKNAEFNKTLCLYHLDKANKNQQAVFARRKNNKQCRLCGQELVNNRKICNRCLDKQVSKHRDKVWTPFKDRKKHGLCLDCGKDNSTSNLYCDQCAKKRIDNQTSIRRLNIANGLCGVCGKNLLAIGKKRCIICIYKYRKWWATSTHRTQNMEKDRLLRDQIVQHYGGECNCCGETERTFFGYRSHQW